MTIYSLMRKGIDLEKVEVEVSLTPGLPNFQIIGLPDAAIRESLLRVKSAIRNSGFKLPQRQQVIISLKPSYEKKTSQGLDLAMAMAFLQKTEQIKLPELKKDLYFYGELSLDGQVSTPNDISLLESTPQNGAVITGCSQEPLGFDHGEIEHLKDITNLIWHVGHASEPSNEFRTHRFENYCFSPAMSRVITIVSAGEHNSFIAGPAGTGKSTFGEVVHNLLRKPNANEVNKMTKISKVLNQEYVGRPLISPHHSSTEVAILGGGIPPTPGAITRAQHGVLLLDEFLEFNSFVKESLREPIEKHEITISRFGSHVKYPADFLLLANSNLCPCGDYVPTEPAKCGYHSTHCKSYYKRLTGPLLDRFEIIQFSHTWGGARVTSLSEIKLKIKTSQEFANESRGQVKMNSRLSLLECEKSLNDFTHKHLIPEVSTSHRRRLALLRVARTIADLEASPEVLGHHLHEAKNLTIQPFRDLKSAWH